MPLSNHVILITGAGGGLGTTAAITLAQQGAHIILLDKSIPRLQATYDLIKAANGREPIMYPFDLAGANEADYQDLADKITEKYGALHGLLHSAALFGGFSPVAIHESKEWGDNMNVNLNAPFLLTRMLLPVMQKNPMDGVIIFTLDSAVRAPIAYAGAYGVSKIALEGFAKILAEELEAFNKIRVNLLVPGPVNSPIRNRAYPGEDKSKLPSMNSLAAVYTYLFGTQSTGITGQVIDARTFNL
jgi:NAD(P)-dependent dehydrogenase (short-subunit alcohol dehydrogenase family)